MTCIRTLIVTLLVLAGPVFAQQAPQTPPPAAQDGFVPVDAPLSVEDTMPAPRLVAIAYAFIWVVFFVYLASLRMRLSTVEKEIDTVRRRTPGGGRPA